jgi:UDP-N-acetylmuramoyl-L-alanyl-D-glutamate--2,6-diaminopimelate ligase
MKKWSELEPVDGVLETVGDRNVMVTGIAFDSRLVEPGFLFVAQQGIHADGHMYIQAAIGKGASVIVCEVMPGFIEQNILLVKVESAARSLGQIAAAWNNFPSQKLKVIGVTGTNGKTSIATLCYQLFSRLGYKTGLISTIQSMVVNKSEPATHTTPDALKIQSLLGSMVNAGCEYCFMEVSSHAVVQHRIEGITFTGGIFTNLTHDHLDYHKTFAEYLKAKKAFFDALPSGAFAITNADDRNGRVMVQNCKARIITYSSRTMADYRCKVIESHYDGMLINFDGQEVWTHFVGSFNASNLLAVYSTAIQLDQSKDEVLPVISELTPVAGRFETIRSLDGKMAVVDYAHTPDA